MPLLAALCERRRHEEPGALLEALSGLPASCRVRQKTGRRACPSPPSPCLFLAPQEGALLRCDAAELSGSGVRPEKAEKSAAFPLLSEAVSLGMSRRAPCLDRVATVGS